MGQGREEQARDRERSRGVPSFPWGSVCFCLFLSGLPRGQMRAGSLAWVGAGRSSVVEQSCRHPGSSHSALGPWHPEGDEVRA